MVTEIAKLISFLTNPLFVLFPMPFLLIYKVSSDSIYALKWTIFSFVFIIISALFLLYGVSRGVFSDLDVSKREQRPILFLFIGFVTLFYLFSLFILKGPPVLYITIIGIMVGLLFVSLINTRLKASLHVATITCVIVTAGILYSLSFLFFLLIPITAWSRIRIKRHTLTEAIVGGIAGLLLTLGMYLFLHI